MKLNKIDSDNKTTKLYNYTLKVNVNWLETGPAWLLNYFHLWKMRRANATTTSSGAGFCFLVYFLNCVPKINHFLSRMRRYLHRPSTCKANIYNTYIHDWGTPLILDGCGPLSPPNQGLKNGHQRLGQLLPAIIYSSAMIQQLNWTIQISKTAAIHSPFCGTLLRPTYVSTISMN